jgi:hypothetical protein
MYSREYDIIEIGDKNSQYDDNVEIKKKRIKKFIKKATQIIVIRKKLKIMNNMNNIVKN